MQLWDEFRDVAKGEERKRDGGEERYIYLLLGASSELTFHRNLFFRRNSLSLIVEKVLGVISTFFEANNAYDNGDPDIQQSSVG